MRAVLRLVAAAWQVLRGLVAVYLVFPRLDAKGRADEIRRWGARTLKAMGVRLEVHGSMSPGVKLVVANHVSWLDVLAIDAVQAVHFVSKAEVRQWPVLGRLVSAGGTLFIAREKRRDALRVVQTMREALQAGITVAVFPEGTTSDGHGLLPFHANLIQAAIDAEVPVQALALRYRDAEHAVSPAAAYTGDTTLLQSAWAIVRARDLVVHVTVLPPQGVRHADRRAVTRRLQQELAQALTD